MIKTELCDMLGIKYPIIQAAMGPATTKKLAVAVSDAGCMGIISHTADLKAMMEGKNMPDDVMRDHIRYVADHCEGNFGCNVRVARLQFDAPSVVDAIIDEAMNNPKVRGRLKLVTTSAGDPNMPSEKFKESGVKEETGLKHFQVVASEYMAKKAEKAGCDGVIAMGHEAGGHIAYSDVNTVVLTPEVVDAVKIPVVATGGICDGRGVAAALLLGAVGAQIGTRFIVTRECDFNEEYKNKILESEDTSTVATGGAVGPIRLIRNPYSEKDQINEAKAIVEGTEKGWSVEKSRRTMLDPANFDFEAADAYGFAEEVGDVEGGPLFAGEVAGRIHDIPTVKELIERIMDEAEEIIKILPGRVIV
ncbi:MAG: hypothetical protein EF807_02165 [Candidatus Methanolliviera hydrocarbonicum]|uniref:Uncharacterized protein n=1 Tax=Candidatus Methanolliviera hydrocarbonicum TaxID=2491085 RepID=A0A520KXY7_9EURY|nr:MAG: hypothetical protein EF807_02165 [Candidatus Methanolliviera hydrocarbonicum]